MLCRHAGKIDVLEELRRIPDARVRQMQAAIASYGHRMHYAADEMAGDALEVLLHALVDAAHDSRERPPSHAACNDFDRWRSPPPSREELRQLKLHVQTDSQRVPLGEHWTSCRDALTDSFASIGPLNCSTAIRGRHLVLAVRDLCRRSCGACHRG